MNGDALDICLGNFCAYLTNTPWESIAVRVGSLLAVQAVGVCLLQSSKSPPTSLASVLFLNTTWDLTGVLV